MATLLLNPATFKKLNFLGSVLYVAAHPDDENTRVIAYLANGRLASTGYLAITRGDGGRNLIGPELRSSLARRSYWLHEKWIRAISFLHEVSYVF